MKTASAPAAVRGTAAPAVPPRRGWVTALAVFTVFTAFAGDFWRLALGWPAYATIASLAGIACAVVVLASRPRVPWRRLPWTLLGFLALCLASLAWSHYPTGSALTLYAQWLGTAGACLLALRFDTAGLLRVLSGALRWVLGLSLVFEFVVAAFVRHPVLPPAVAPPDGHVSLLLYWSRGLLFSGGRIQGIVGNANTLAFAALVALIVFGIRFAGNARERRGRVSGIVWIVVAAGTLVLTGSATILACTIAVALVLAVALLARRARTPRGRALVYAGTALGAVLAAAAIVGFWSRLLALVGRRGDLTGRTETWHTVSQLAGQHPVLGWGFSSPWVPWEPPFKNLVIIHDVQQLQANNAWLDVAFQLGLVGVVLFSAALAGLAWRSWFRAVDRPRLDAAHWGPHRAATLLPLAVTTLLVVYGLAESGVLLSAGWMLLVTFALRTGLLGHRDALPERGPA